MGTLLDQLGGLLLGSVPTMVFFILLVFAYGLLVRRPLDAILAERRKRTTGAMEQARSAISAAEHETAIFEERLREARRQILDTRERRLKQLAAEREAALGQLRNETQSRVSSARETLEQSVVVARQQIEARSAELSAQIVGRVLPAGVAVSEVAQ